MRLSEIGELSLIEIIRNRFTKKSKDIIVGIGDDAAVIEPCEKNLLLTTDMMVERIHFDLSFITPYHLGYKLVSINVSDIYAMGGIPQYLLLDIAMNKDTEKSFLDEFLNGIKDSMRLYSVSLIGGDISSSKKDIIVAASLIGYAKKPARRSGARPGDKIYVTGNLGDPACGLEILKRLTPESKQTVKSERLKVKSEKNKNLFITLNPQLLTLNWRMAKPLLRRHLMPEARNPEGFVRYATAMIDISDGLFIDLSRLCTESKVGARIYMKAIPISHRMKKVSSILGLDSFKLATSGGEDYELLFTAPVHPLIRGGAGGVKITCIGEITEKDRIVVNAIGKEIELKAEGYQHFTVEQ